MNVAASRLLRVRHRAERLDEVDFSSPHNGTRPNPHAPAPGAPLTPLITRLVQFHVAIDEVLNTISWERGQRASQGFETQGREQLGITPRSFKNGRNA
jgi:hypothetical protein